MIRADTFATRAVWNLTLTNIIYLSKVASGSALEAWATGACVQNEERVQGDDQHGNTNAYDLQDPNH
jgi:hypothetical protein